MLENYNYSSLFKRKVNYINRLKGEEKMRKHNFIGGNELNIIMEQFIVTMLKITMYLLIIFDHAKKLYFLNKI